MATLTITSKRQATFPKEACESLGVWPGDLIDLVPCDLDGERVWVLRPRPARRRHWLGCLKKRAKTVDDHSLEAVRASIATGRRSDR